MPIRVTCPGCHTAAVCPDEYRGRALRCKKCGGSFVAAAPRRPAARAAPAPRRRLSPLVLALAAVLLAAAVGLPAAYFVLSRERQPDGLTAAPPTVADPGPAPRPAETPKQQEPPRDTGQKPPPVAPRVAWQDFTSRDWGFSARFPAAPQAVSRPGQERRPQMFVATVPLSPDGKQAQFTITCTDHEARETADAAAFLAAVTAELAPEAGEKTPLKLGAFPGVELSGEKKDARGTWVTTQRLYVVRSRLYALYAGAPRDEAALALFKPFFDSFTLLDPGPAPAPPPSPPPARAPREKPAAPPKGGLAELRLAAPAGWEAHYNKFALAWKVTKPPPTARSEGEEVRIEECPADARTQAEYAAHLKQKDFLNADLPGWVQVGQKEALPDGFVIRGIVKKYDNPKTPPTLGLLAVRDIAGMRVRCFSANLRSEKSRDDALEMFKAATFGMMK